MIRVSKEFKSSVRIFIYYYFKNCLRSKEFIVEVNGSTVGKLSVTEVLEIKD